MTATFHVAEVAGSSGTKDAARADSATVRAVDAKALPFGVRDVPPGLHRWMLPRGGKRKVPLLVDEGFVVQDSAAIAAYLDERYGAPRLLTGGDEAARVLELERYFGQIGRRRVLRGL